jgi:hypothetical protein
VQPRDTSPCSIGYLDFRSLVPSQDNEKITFMTLVMMFHTARTFFITERKEEIKQLSWSTILLEKGNSG